jgi:homoserine kinase
MSDRARVTVPATTANLGPGFDCLGAALTLYNRFEFVRLAGESASLQIAVRGTEADRVAADESNLAYQAFCRAYEHLQQTPPPVRMEIELDVPLARGLGSSATGIVGGLLAANGLEDQPLSETELMRLAIAIEGHPDNVVPALLGGCRLAVSDGDDWQICEIPWHETLVPVVAIPNFELSTAEARQVLPDRYSRADAIYNAAHLGLLLRGLETGNWDWIGVGMGDRVHQPYRGSLIAGYEAVRAAALNAGASGVAISGAGPTLLALTLKERSQDVAIAMATAWQQAGTIPQVKALQIEPRGAFLS